MLWIADYALAQGWKVSGSDLADGPALERLRQKGALIHIGVDASAIPADVTEAVITSAITESAPHFPEYEEIVRRKLPVVKRALWIGKITKRYYTIAVCGSHGKTTTTALIGWILDQAGLDPTVFVGGTVGAWEGTRIGQGKYLVIEADEFDRSFHHFFPKIAVVLNIDLDHTDYYRGGIEEIEHAYRRFLRNLPPKSEGMVIGYGRDGRVRKAVRGFKYRERWYDEAHLWPGIHPPQPGQHMLLNATAAARVAHELGVDHDTIKRAIAHFPGAGRRFEALGTWKQVELYDDYAHHPRELKAFLAALAERYPNTPTTVVFQPHQKARTKALLTDFGRVLDDNPPTSFILAPIYFVAGREDAIDVSSEDIAKEIAKKPVSSTVLVAGNRDELEKLVREAADKPGVLAVVGAGDIRTMLDQWRR